MEVNKPPTEEQVEISEIEMTEGKWALLKELSDLDIVDRIRGIKETITSHGLILAHPPTLSEKAQHGEEV